MTAHATKDDNRLLNYHQQQTPPSTVIADTRSASLHKNPLEGHAPA
jgi:hypothetical protein